MRIQYLKLQPATGIGYFMRVDSKTEASVWAASAPTSKLKCYVTVGKPNPLKLPSMIVGGEFEILLKLDYQLCHILKRSALLNTEEQIIDQQEFSNLRLADDEADNDLSHKA